MFSSVHWFQLWPWTTLELGNEVKRKKDIRPLLTLMTVTMMQIGCEHTSAAHQQVWKKQVYECLWMTELTSHSDQWRNVRFTFQNLFNTSLPFGVIVTTLHANEAKTCDTWLMSSVASCFQHKVEHAVADPGGFLEFRGTLFLSFCAHVSPASCVCTSSQRSWTVEPPFQILDPPLTCSSSDPKVPLHAYLQPFQ